MKEFWKNLRNNPTFPWIFVSLIMGIIAYTVIFFTDPVDGVKIEESLECVTDTEILHNEIEILQSELEMRNEVVRVQMEYLVKIKPNIKYVDAKEIIDAMNDNYERTGLSLMNFYGICAQESRFNKKAIGMENKNDVGICQINKHTYEYFRLIGIMKGVWDMKKMKNISYNIKTASLILERYREQLERRYPTGEKEFIDMLLINAYNRGVGGSVKEYKSGSNLGYYLSVKKFERYWKEG